MLKIFKSITVNIPVCSAEEADEAARFLESFRPKEPVEIKRTMFHCLTVTAHYSPVNAMIFKHYVKQRSFIIDGFAVLIEED